MSDVTKKTGMSPRELVTFALLIAMYIFLMADSRLMSAIIPELSREYGVDKQALGMIGTAFVLAGAAVGIVIGFWSDRVPRKKLLVAIVLVGEIPCLLTGFEFFTQSLEAFIALRVLTGIGMGGITPITYSLVSDTFHEDDRAKAAAGITVAWAIGILMGPSLAGYLTDDYGWRIGFILAAAPNFPLALIFWFVAKEPARGPVTASFVAPLRIRRAADRNCRSHSPISARCCGYEPIALSISKVFSEPSRGGSPASGRSVTSKKPQAYPRVTLRPSRTSWASALSSGPSLSAFWATASIGDDLATSRSCVARESS